MKLTNFKFLVPVLMISLLSLQGFSTYAHTFRFCNMSTAAVTAGINYWACSNPPAVTIQPGQSYDFSRGCDMKGAWVGSDANSVTAAVAADSDTYYTHSSHSSSRSINLTQDSKGNWSIADTDLGDCTSPTASASTSSSDSSDSANASSSTSTDTSGTSSSSSSSSNGSSSYPSGMSLGDAINALATYLQSTQDSDTLKGYVKDFIKQYGTQLQASTIPDYTNLYNVINQQLDALKGS